jgi:hypothetical protein
MAEKPVDTSAYTIGLITSRPLIASVGERIL